MITRAEYRDNDEGYLDFSRPEPHLEHRASLRSAEIAPAQTAHQRRFRRRRDCSGRRTGRKFTSPRIANSNPTTAWARTSFIPCRPAAARASEVARIAGAVRSISISKDGSRLAFLGALNTPVQSHTKTNLWVVDLKPGAAPRNLSTKYDWDIGGGILGDQEPPRGGGGIRPLWSADGKWFTVLVAKAGPRQSRAIQRRFRTGHSAHQRRSSHRRSTARNGSQMVAEVSTPTMINDLFMIGSDGTQKRLTNVNEKLFSELNLTPPEEIWYQSFDGRKIQTWVQKPPDFDPEQKISADSEYSRRAARRPRICFLSRDAIHGGQGIRGSLSQSSRQHFLR